MMSSHENRQYGGSYGELLVLSLYNCLTCEIISRVRTEKSITLIFDFCDITLLSPVNFSWQAHVTRFQVSRAASLSLVGNVVEIQWLQVQEAEFILSEVSKVVHGQAI